MAGRIPASFIQTLLSRTDLVALVSSFVALKQRGRDHWGCCPFHDEKSPSFKVSTERQQYYCFGCQASGNAIDFVMNHQHLGFVDAVEQLAARVGLSVEREDELPAEKIQRQRARSLQDVLAFAAECFSGWLWQDTPEAREAQRYLKKRGLDAKIARHFQLGLAPDHWDGLLNEALRANIDPTLLEAAGLIRQRKSGDGHFDYFRNRLMFPIRDERGRVIAFGGRTLGNDQAKYLNSPETETFSKRKHLYGLYERNQSRQTSGQFLVVEGYMDVIALHQHGLTEAVACLGTAVSENHLELMFRRADTLVFCLDGDKAGKAAAWKALDTCLPQLREGLEARFLFLPEGEDPDSLVQQQGASAFRQRLEGAKTLEDVLFETLESSSGRGVAGMARLHAEVTRRLKLVRDPVWRKLLSKLLHDKTGLTVDLSATAVPQPSAPVPAVPDARPVPATPQDAPAPMGKQDPYWHQVALILTLAPQLNGKVRTDADMPAQLQQLLDTIREHDIRTTAALMAQLNGTPLGTRLVHLVANAHSSFRSTAPEKLEVRLQELQQHRLVQQEINALSGAATELTNKGLGNLSDAEKQTLKTLYQSLARLRSG
jgi:DNA primase